MASCPSGCPRDQFPREAAVFDPRVPHIIVVWDGIKIDKVPIPMSQVNAHRDTPLRLTSEEVLGLVRNFLSTKGSISPSLFMRIHSRDPVTE
jgi:hypothetical protein